MRPHTCPWPPLANQEVAQAPFRIPVLGRLQALTYLGGAGEMQWSIRDSFRGQHYVAKGSRFGFIRALSNWSFERKKNFCMDVTVYTKKCSPVSFVVLQCGRPLVHKYLDRRVLTP